MGWSRRSRAFEIRRLTIPEFQGLLPSAFRIFADAMGYPDSYVQPRIRLATTQLAYPDLRAFGAFDGSSLIGFAYGYRVIRGQWWADEVARALQAPEADRSQPWLDDAFELCEIHVSPQSQGKGAGRALLRAIGDAQPCRTILLSTPSGPTKAAQLYAAEGYLTLARRFRFSGDARDFDILGRTAPGHA